ncbi:MAG: ATP phosphoribosyltransferase regulatory subunit [Betaproteobacteria bacterium]|nr:ATP phosphoribosyltransferase regulatory subunit [Betaproteobacteria bacterium]
MRNWLLPEYIEDILPPEAEQLEFLRRRLLDHCHRHGYLLVQPPLVEHLESLLTGTGSDLDLRTFKVVDQMSGRLLGIRADITQQVARIDAHLLNRQGTTRLCYAGSVLHTRPAGLQQTREVLQLGAELYGHASIAADREVLALMLSSLQAIGVPCTHLDLGHVAVFRALARAAGLDAEAIAEITAAMVAKDLPQVDARLATLAEPWRGALSSLPRRFGDAAAVLRAARSELPALPAVVQALDELQVLTDAAQTAVEDLQVDLADLRGLHYHTGAVFAAYTRGESSAIAKGGRYDDIGRAFGRARPATGFTLYLRQLARLAPAQALPRAILAPDDADPALQSLIAGLRQRGEAVVLALGGEESTDELPEHDRRILHQGGTWKVEPV